MHRVTNPGGGGGGSPSIPNCLHWSESPLAGVRGDTCDWCGNSKWPPLARPKLAVLALGDLRDVSRCFLSHRQGGRR